MRQVRTSVPPRRWCGLTLARVGGGLARCCGALITGYSPVLERPRLLPFVFWATLYDAAGFMGCMQVRLHPRRRLFQIVRGAGQSTAMGCVQFIVFRLVNELGQVLGTPASKRTVTASPGVDARRSALGHSSIPRRPPMLR